MPLIRTDPGYVTQINHIKVDPRNADELVGKMRHQLETVVARAPGFISSSIHRSHDGHHVVNYVQFTSAQLLDDVHHSEGFQTLLASYRPLVIEGGPILYDVAEVRERSTEAFPSAIAEAGRAEKNATRDPPAEAAPPAPTITEADIFTQIVEFEVAPERQHDLIAALAAEVERWVRHRPGFLSASFHASHDGKRVFNYAQWLTEADFRAFVADPEGERIAAAIRAVGGVTGPRAAHCRVVRVIAPAGDRSLQEKGKA